MTRSQSILRQFTVHSSFHVYEQEIAQITLADTTVIAQLDTLVTNAMLTLMSVNHHPATMVGNYPYPVKSQ